MQISDQVSDAEVSERRVWHVLRVYHRLVMAGCATEALAESVCSTLTIQTRACVGRPPKLGDVITAVRLRLAGVNGGGQDYNFLRRTMDIYFRGRPWHVCVGKRALELRAQRRSDAPTSHAMCRGRSARTGNISRRERPTCF